jgi:hypothetical protein
MSGCKIKLNACKSGDGIFRCLLDTLPELLRGVWVPQTATLLRVLLFKSAHHSMSRKHSQDHNKSANCVLIASPLEKLR